MKKAQSEADCTALAMLFRTRSTGHRSVPALLRQKQFAGVREADLILFKANDVFVGVNDKHEVVIGKTQSKERQTPSFAVHAGQQQFADAEVDLLIIGPAFEFRIAVGAVNLNLLNLSQKFS